MMLVVLVGVAAAAGNQPPLPPWQQELLAKRGNPRVSVHRGGLPEHDELRRAGAAIGLPSLDVPVVVGMTTTPTRLPNIEPAIASLLNQTQPATLVLNIPQVYTDRRGHWRNKRSSIPEWLERRAAADARLVIHRVPTDWGPATKLVGTAIAARRGLIPTDERTVVVAADDDHEWEPYALATLVRHGFARNTSAVWSYFTYDFPHTAERPKLCVAQAGDMLATRLANLRGLEAWADELLAPAGTLQPCFFVDDLFFAAYFAHLGNVAVWHHPWKYWLFKEAQKHSASPAPCKKACSPVVFRLRYPDGLAMGEPRARHSRGCMMNLDERGWWPREETTCHFDKTARS